MKQRTSLTVLNLEFCYTLVWHRLQDSLGRWLELPTAQLLSQTPFLLKRTRPVFKLGCVAGRFSKTSSVSIARKATASIYCL